MTMTVKFVHMRLEKRLKTKDLAELFNPHFKENIEKNEKLLWTEILEKSVMMN